MRCKTFLAIVLLFFIVSLFNFASAVSPSGATVISVSNETAQMDSAGSHEAVAGNVSEINIFGYTTTQAWQGYFGNVTGTIRLADSIDNALYNWSLASPQGEIYASNSSSITWTSIDCFDMATNHLAFESFYGIASSDVDGVNETFNLKNHQSFYTNNIEFTAGQCNNTKLYNNAGAGTFDEVLLSDGTNVVFASILEEDVIGFDGSTYDFEMIVLEDGHGTDTTTTTYYFWVELE
jgi:hypothetical protein